MTKGRRRRWRASGRTSPCAPRSRHWTVSLGNRPLSVPVSTTPHSHLGAEPEWPSFSRQPSLGGQAVGGAGMGGARPPRPQKQPAPRVQVVKLFLMLALSFPDFMTFQESILYLKLILFFFNDPFILVFLCSPLSHLNRHPIWNFFCFF